jgi:hypothetical protein
VGRIRIFDSRSAGWKGVIVGAICESASLS